MTAEKIISRHPLDNGLILEFRDLSRHTAGDRWQVTLEARIAVPVRPEYLPPELQEKWQEVAEALGPEVCFSHQETRNFVDERLMPELLKEMETRLLQGMKRYASHPEFGARFLRRRYNEYLERSRWWREE